VRADEKLTVFMELELADSRWPLSCLDKQARFFQD
jgi:hypothetical protein